MLQQLGDAACLNGHRPDAQKLLNEWLDLPIDDDVEVEDLPPQPEVVTWLWDLLDPPEELKALAAEPEPEELNWDDRCPKDWLERLKPLLLNNWGNQRAFAFAPEKGGKDGPVASEAHLLGMEHGFLDLSSLSKVEHDELLLWNVALNDHIDPEGILSHARRCRLHEQKGWDAPEPPQSKTPESLEQFQSRLEYCRLIGGLCTLPVVLDLDKYGNQKFEEVTLSDGTVVQSPIHKYIPTLEEGCAWVRAGKPDDLMKCITAWRKETESIKSIQGVVDQLYEMEKKGLTTKKSWADRQFKRSQLGGYRIRHEEIDRRLMEMVADEWGLNIGDSGKVERKGRSMLGGLKDGESFRPQVPGFTLMGKDALLAAPGGVGKSLGALGLSFTTATGIPAGLDVTDSIDPEAMGATLWIGTDGGDGAFAMIDGYIKMLGVSYGSERKWRGLLNFWGADAETGETPWAFNVKGLHQLFGELEAGYNGTPYRLVVIDSLKAVMELGGLDFGIGPMGTCMRLIQAAAARFNVAVLWIHHMKPGASKSDMGIDGTGGNSNINQIPFCVHTLDKVNRKGFDHVVRWNVQKYRGECSRDTKQFQYVLDRDKGMFMVLGPDEASSDADVFMPMWLRRDDGIATTELLDCVDMSKKTLQKRLTDMGKEGMVKSLKKRWHITPKGLECLVAATPEIGEEVDAWLKEQKRAPQV